MALTLETVPSTDDDDNDSSSRDDHDAESKLPRRSTARRPPIYDVDDMEELDDDDDNDRTNDMARDADDVASDVSASPVAPTQSSSVRPRVRLTGKRSRGAIDFATPSHSHSYYDSCATDATTAAVGATSHAAPPGDANEEDEEELFDDTPELPSTMLLEPTSPTQPQSAAGRRPVPSQYSQQATRRSGGTQAVQHTPRAGRVRPRAFEYSQATHTPTQSSAARTQLLEPELDDDEDIELSPSPPPRSPSPPPPAAGALALESPPPAAAAHRGRGLQPMKLERSVSPEQLQERLSREYAVQQHHVAAEHEVEELGSEENDAAEAEALKLARRQRHQAAVGVAASSSFAAGTSLLVDDIDDGHSNEASNVSPVRAADDGSSTRVPQPTTPKGAEAQVALPKPTSTERWFDGLRSRATDTQGRYDPSNRSRRMPKRYVCVRERECSAIAVAVRID